MRLRGLVALGAALCTVATLGVAVPRGAAAVPGGCSHVSSAYRPVLKYGDTGAAVMQAQCLSNAWGGEPPKLTVDGVFDTGMVKKIQWIEGCHGLARNGIIGPDTWHVLYYPALDCYHPYPV